nr:MULTISPECIES: ECF transporter S component [Microbacterium]
MLVCAAIGVATGIATALWTPLHGASAGVAIPLYGLVLGFHALPGVIAQQVLRLPWVALLTHALAALIACAFVPVMTGRYLLAALVFGGVQEGVSALTRYRHWEAWRFLLSGVITGAVLALPLWFAFDVSALAPWAGVLFVVFFLVGPVAWTAVGLAIGSALRRAGVARRTA